MGSDNMANYELTIDGKSHDVVEYEDVINPATEEVVGQLPMATEADLNAAVKAAQDAFKLWSVEEDSVRKTACHAIAAAIEEHQEELAKLVTQEQGKPLNGIGSRFEIGGCVGWSHYTGDLDIPVEALQDNEEGRIEMHRKPVGVVGSITPWNWPVLIAIWHVLPAIRSGCTVVLKPSPYTSLSTIRMVEIVNKVLPKGVLNVISGDNSLGALMSKHEGINKIVFTGSTPTGKKIMHSAAPTLKRLTLELGGNDAGIVLVDSNPKAIAEGLFWGAFINNGQTCAALKRLYVHENIFDDVCSALVEFAKNIPVGNGLDENNILGPLTNKMQYDKVVELVEDAKKNGAEILLGGSPSEGKGYFYPPTIVRNVTQDTRLVKEEQFGPALPIMSFKTVEEAIALANDDVTGLGASVWTGDKAAALEIAKKMESGSVWINSHGMLNPHIPFGGVKGSGFGVEFGKEGLLEYTTIQAIHGL